MPALQLPDAWAKASIFHVKFRGEKLTFFNTITCPHPKWMHIMVTGQYTLLDNEAVFHAVQRYLAAQNLGTITPHLLCCHVNDVILLALEMTKKMAALVNALP